MNTAIWMVRLEYADMRSIPGAVTTPPIWFKD
jgi:hypothetical protein